MPDPETIWRERMREATKAYLNAVRESAKRRAEYDAEPTPEKEYQLSVALHEERLAEAEYLKANRILARVLSGEPPPYE